MSSPKALSFSIEEFAPAAIQGVATSTVGFVSVSQRAPVAGPLFSFVDFQRVVGAANVSPFMALAVQGFFENGGQSCYVARIASGDPLQKGLDDLAGVRISLVCCPDDPQFANAAAVTAAYCEKRKDCFALLQPAAPLVPDASNEAPVNSKYAAYYYPWLTVPGLTGGSSVTIPPCGHVAGVYAQTDATRGVWTAPAGTSATLMGVTGLSQDLTDAEAAALDANRVSVIRNIHPYGNVVWGARTTSQNPQWKYVNVRRLLIYIEQSVAEGLQWVVFEPNGPGLWKAVQHSIESFLRSVWMMGGLKGQKANEAYFVKCGLDTMTQADLNSGQLVIVIGVAPTYPAEFVVIQITQLVGMNSAPSGSTAKT